MRAGEQVNSDRYHEVTRDVAEEVIKAAPTEQWKLLIMLSRYGGLRHGSETRSLKWDDCDFKTGTIDVPGAKGIKRDEKGDIIPKWRLIPMFPELRNTLEECHKAAIEKHGDLTGIYCLEEVIGTDANIWAKLTRIIRDAGQDRWPRLWHNMRATRDSELSCGGVPSVIVAKLLGNSVATSAKHYKHLTKKVLKDLQKPLSEEGAESHDSSDV